MKRAGRFILVLILAVTGFLLNAPRQVAGQATLYVDGACADADSDGRCDDGITYRTIQAAVDDAEEGDTIRVAAGLYVEQLEIEKSLTVVGAGPCTLIRPPDTLTECPPLSGSFPVVCVHDADNVQLSDLTVDGAGRGNGLTFHGIGFYEAGGRVSGVEIRGIHDTPFGSSAVRGVGLYARSDSPHTLTVEQSTIHRFHKNGLELGGSGLTAQVMRSSVTGAGPTSLVAQNGIVVRDGAMGTIGPANRVEGVALVPQGSSSGVLVWFATADVMTNTIADAQVGIYYWASGGRALDNDVTASAAGVGSTDYWGVIIGSPDISRVSAAPELAGYPSPSLDAGETESPAGMAFAQQATLQVDGNRLLGGGDSAESAGIWLVPGAGTGETRLTGARNHIAAWADGIRIVRKAGVNLDVGVNWNWIAGNSAYGLRISGVVGGVQAERNWWGDGSGPAPYGTGDAVVAGVPVTPWLRQTVLPAVMREATPPQPYPDLRISRVTVEPEYPTVGEPVTVTVEVENTGPVAAAPFWVDLYDNPVSPPDRANQIWNYLCPGPVIECYGIAWYLEEGLQAGGSAQLSSLGGTEEQQTHWTGAFATAGRHDIYAFADSWNRTLWYGAVLEQNEGLDNRFGPVVVCVQPGAGRASLPVSAGAAEIPPRPDRP